MISYLVIGRMVVKETDNMNCVGLGLEVFWIAYINSLTKMHFSSI